MAARVNALEESAYSALSLRIAVSSPAVYGGNTISSSDSLLRTLAPSSSLNWRSLEIPTRDKNPGVIASEEVVRS